MFQWVNRVKFLLIKIFYNSVQCSVGNMNFQIFLKITAFFLVLPGSIQKAICLVRLSISHATKYKKVSHIFMTTENLLYSSLFPFPSYFCFTLLMDFVILVIQKRHMEHIFSKYKSFLQLEAKRTFVKRIKPVNLIRIILGKF